MKSLLLASLLSAVAIAGIVLFSQVYGRATKDVKWKRKALYGNLSVVGLWDLENFSESIQFRLLSMILGLFKGLEELSSYIALSLKCVTRETV